MDISVDDRYRDPAQRAAAVGRASTLGISREVVESIQRISGRLSRSRLRDQHLEELGRAGCVVLTTGQQVGLFGGPLLTFYKALTVIRAARALGEETGRAVVPIFWLQAEDHDLAEISSCTIPAASASGQSSSPADQPVTLELTPERARGSRASVGHLVLGPAVESLREEFLRKARGLPFVEEVAELLRRHYRPESTFVEAFAGMIGEIFAEEGLLVLNPRDPALAPVLRPLFRRALNEYREITERLLLRGKELQVAESQEQVFVRHASPLFFFHPDGPDGPRFRLEWNGRDWSYVGREGEISWERLTGFLETEPGRFSSSALLRPLIQDSILPSAGYVGGEAELRYLRQVEPLYPLFERVQPPAIPRARFVIRDAKARRLIEQLGLKTEDALGDKGTATAALLAQFKEGDATPEALESRIMRQIDAIFETVEPDLVKVNPGLTQAAHRGREKIERVISGIKERYSAALLEKHEVSLTRLERVRQFLLPGGVPQERVLSTAYFLAKFGPALKSAVLEQIDPFSASLKVLDV